MTQPNGDFTPRTRDGVSLKEYIDTRIESVEQQHRYMVAAQAAALETARVNLEKRLDALNELRSMVSDSQQLFVLKGEYRQAHETVTANINRLNIYEATLAGKATQKQVSWAVAFSCFTLLLSLVSIILVLVLK